MWWWQRQHPPGTALPLLSYKTQIYLHKTGEKMGFICHIHQLLLPRHPAQALSWLNYPKKQKGGVTISCFGIKGINSDFSLSTAQLATGLKHGADGYEIIANSYSLD